MSETVQISRRGAVRTLAWPLPITLPHAFATGCGARGGLLPALSEANELPVFSGILHAFAEPVDEPFVLIGADDEPRTGVQEPRAMRPSSPT